MKGMGESSSYVVTELPKKPHPKKFLADGDNVYKDDKVYIDYSWKLFDKIKSNNYEKLVVFFQKLNQSKILDIRKLLNTACDSMLPIHLVVMYYKYTNENFFKAINLLVVYGADIKGKDAFGRTALHLCIDSHYLAEGLKFEACFIRWNYQCHDRVLIERMGFLLQFGCEGLEKYPIVNKVGKLVDMTPSSLPTIYPGPVITFYVGMRIRIECNTAFAGYTALQCLRAVLINNFGANEFYSKEKSLPYNVGEAADITHTWLRDQYKKTPFAVQEKDRRQKEKEHKQKEKEQSKNSGCTLM